MSSTRHRRKRAVADGTSPRTRVLLLVGVLVVATLLAAVAMHQIVTWPNVASLSANNPKTTSFMERYRSDQTSRGKRPSLAWRWVPYERISPHLKRAVVAAEDMSFFFHGGFDLVELKEAAKEATEGLDLPRGASTITQQLAKNLWLSPSRNPLRKVKEAALTWQLERHLTKRRILELYLNVAEFGPGVYGAEAAARRYYDTQPENLDEEQSATLAAGLPMPSKWHPGSPSEKYRRRVETIRLRMAKAEFIWKRI